jgi:hypothetical protein
MLELILQQRYRVDGIPVDISPYRNHGIGFDAPKAPGPAPDHDVVLFPHPASRVSIGLGTQRAWAPLLALKVEVLARVDPRAARTLTLVEGDKSFRFGILETALEASFHGPPGGGTYIRSDSSYAPDGQFHAAPANRWARLGFSHDGFGKMKLFIDGAVVAETTVAGAVPAVQAGGVSIGNAVTGGTPLLGEIDEVSIWRAYPRGVDQEFLCRPYDKATAQCWEAVFRAVRDWVKREPTEAQALASLLAAQQRRLLRTLFLLPPAEQTKVRASLQEYARLWCQGRIDGPEMREVLRRWLAALRQHGVDPASDPYRAELESLRQRAAIDPRALTLDCDPAAAAFLRLLEQAIQGPGSEVK